MSISSLLSSKGIYLNNYMDERSEYQIGSAQAKTEYFLTPDDLATLQCAPSPEFHHVSNWVGLASAGLTAGPSFACRTCMPTTRNVPPLPLGVCNTRFDLSVPDPRCERPGGWGAGPSRYYCSKVRPAPTPRLSRSRTQSLPPERPCSDRLFPRVKRQRQRLALPHSS